MLPLVLAVAVAVSAGDTIRPAETFEPAAIIVHRQPALPVIALRLSLLANDPPGYAGAGHLIQHLVYPSLQDQVERVGGEVRIERNSDAVVYTVVGPASELRYLAGMLKSALRPLTPRAAELPTARRTLHEERLAEWETAGAHVRSLVRARLFPQDLSAAGIESSLARIDADAVRDVWAAMYHPERVSVVAVGDVRTEDVRNAFTDLSPPSSAQLRAKADTVSAAPLAPAQATHGWFALGYPAPDADPAALLVTTRLLRSLLREQLPQADIDAEHWWTHHGQALVAVIAAPEDELDAVRPVLESPINVLREALVPDQVRAASAAIRRDMLFFARTPGNMASVVGRFVDRGGDPLDAQEFYSRLEAVDEDDVRRVLEQLAESTPVRLDVPPQELPDITP